MQRDSLFGHLASRSGQPEDVATEALNYVLNRSSLAQHVFLEYLRQATGVELPETLLFRTQATGDDNARPDLVGTDSKSRQVILVESKFWAGLTDNQPVTYLERLPDETDALLLFVAPAKRFSTLWSELLRRCQNGNTPIERSHEDISQDFRATRVGYTRTLALTSWRSLLTYIQRALETEGEVLAASDVQQLQGLCERMDSDAFLPLRSEELTSDTGARIRQYCEIVNEVVDEAKAQGIASTAGLRPTAMAAFYGRYFEIQGVQCHLSFSADLWARRRATPIWLRVDSWLRGDHAASKTNAGAKPMLREALASLEREYPPRLIEDGNHLLIPLDVKTGVEKQDVVSHLFEQVKEVEELLQAYDRPQ